MRLTIKEIFELPPDGRSVTVKGWVRTKRETKSAVFLEVNDGSRMGNMQCVFDEAAAAKVAAPRARPRGYGASVSVEGNLIPSPASGQKLEVKASRSSSSARRPPTAIPSRKRRTPSNSSGRSPTSAPGPIPSARWRVSATGWPSPCTSSSRSAGFNYVHTPIITTSDCRGRRGDVPGHHPRPREDRQVGEAVDYSKDFFGKSSLPHRLGPAQRRDLLPGPEPRLYLRPDLPRREFQHHPAPLRVLDDRARGRLQRHRDNMDLAEDFLKHLASVALADCAEDLAFFDKRIQSGLVDMLSKMRSPRLSRG
jgi:asparaginyl-tRNA synthetase